MARYCLSVLSLLREAGAIHSCLRAGGAGRVTNVRIKNTFKEVVKINLVISSDENSYSAP